MTTGGGSSGGSGGGSPGGSDYEKSKTPSAGRVKDLSGASDTSRSLDGLTASVSKSDSLSPTSGAGSAYGGTGGTNSLSPAGGGSGGVPVGVTPGAGDAAPGSGDGSGGTPRSDFSVVLAGQVGKRADRSPSRSNNFVSLVGGAGGLGRRSAESKRTLIGGA